MHENNGKQRERKFMDFLKRLLFESVKRKRNGCEIFKMQKFFDKMSIKKESVLVDYPN